jgi:dUTP pyrophosphatase
MTNISNTNTGFCIPIKFKRLESNSTIPTRAHETDAGFDITVTRVEFEEHYVSCFTGICVDIPAGYVGLLFPRSSISKLPSERAFRNSVGVIDSGYQGEISIRLTNTYLIDEPIEPNEDEYYDRIALYQSLVGTKIAQLVIMPIPNVQFVEVAEFDTQTDRGQNGFGSTGA